MERADPLDTVTELAHDTQSMPHEELADDEHYCISEVDLFQDLSRREIAAIGARAPLRSVASGQVIYHPWQPVTVLFIVKRGRVRLYRTTSDGRSVTNAILEPGAVFGEMEPLGLRMRTNWADALEATELCLMSRSDVKDMLFSDPRIAQRIAESLSARIDELERRLTDLTCKTLGERLSGTLCSLASKRPAEPIRLTHQQLAALVGASRERTTTALSELVRHELIMVRRGKIAIKDLDGLRRYADGVRSALS